VHIPANVHREWVKKMIATGLPPAQKRLSARQGAGRSMSGCILPLGNYIALRKSILQTGFAIPWVDC
jgi:hypothetical protein